MNIFFVDHDPKAAARALCDQHVCKMIVESTQLLSNCLNNHNAPYRRTHMNHPCTKWAHASVANFQWLLEHALWLCDEYFKRYGKIHACLKHITYMREVAARVTNPGPITPPPQCMPDEYKGDDPVEAYRRYYRAEKMRFARYRYSAPPAWLDV